MREMRLYSRNVCRHSSFQVNFVFTQKLEQTILLPTVWVFTWIWITRVLLWVFPRRSTLDMLLQLRYRPQTIKRTSTILLCHNCISCSKALSNNFIPARWLAEWVQFSLVVSGKIYLEVPTHSLLSAWPMVKVANHLS